MDAISSASNLVPGVRVFISHFVNDASPVPPLPRLPRLSRRRNRCFSPAPAPAPAAATASRCSRVILVKERAAAQEYLSTYLGLGIMDLFAIDSDSESYTGTSDSEDQEECQLGRVVGVAMFVDLETSSGDLIKDVNSKKLSRTLVPVSTLGDYDFWPGQFVLEKLAVEDSARYQRTGIVRDVDALERTVHVTWISPAGSDTSSYGSDPTVETVSAYELVEHPDFSFCTGEVVIRSAVNIDKSEADLTNGPLASSESLVTHSDFLSCIGNVLGYKDDGIEVQWANGVISKVHHFEIIGLDKLLDGSLESMNEEQATGDSVDMTEPEEMQHDNANIVLESTEDCTGSLCKVTAFLFPRTAFDFLTNVAASLFGTHGSRSPSSVMVDPRYQIVKMAEMQTSAEELPEEQIVTRGWVKKVQQEWTILQNDLPDGIHVRVFEERMDLLRSCIVGADGTPYHDNLFFFDIFFPPDYPHEPPAVHYHSGGLRLNPNLYESGKALVLNEKPYFNEAGYDKFLGKADGEKNSITYNENAFLLSCKSMMYILHKPPKHFEKLVKEHFTCRAPHILDACEAYLGGDLSVYAALINPVPHPSRRNPNGRGRRRRSAAIALLHPPMATSASKSYLCAGSSSFDDPDVVEVTPAAAAAGGWASGHHKRKRSQIQSSLVDEIPGPSTYVSKYANPWVDLKMFHDDAFYNYSDDFPYEGFDEDYVYDEDEFEDDGYDASPFENDYNYSLSSKFDNLGIPPGVEVSLPWMQKAAIEIGNKSKPTKIMDDKIQEKYKAFKQFDTVDDHNTIFVRAYEDRMDLLRAVIMGPAGTPYHDGLFFFDIYFPPQYPNVPPKVNYRAGGLRLNPNLYACGKVLVSIQALVLNAKPYFNEPGYAMQAKTPHGEKKSLSYNEDTFLLSCRTMLYSLRNPPKNFEDFVAGHFRKYGRNILVACRAYLDGAQVGCLAGDGVQDVDEGDKSCSVRFKQSLKRLFEELQMEFIAKGADCDKFVNEKARSGASTAAADTTLRL
nr:unnamed protein product [Digitaria exilis]